MDPVRRPSSRLQLLTNHIYEFRKGVRPMMLFTSHRDDLPFVRSRLDAAGIDYFVQNVGANTINVYFGKHLLIETTRRIVNKPLAALSPEEDFMLGMLLGYAPEQQCERYLGHIADAACA